MKKSANEAIHLDICLRDRWVRGSRVALEYLGREQLRVPDQPDDVVVAGENPHLVLGVPVDWVLRSEATEVAIGIGNDVRSEQVVVDRGCHTCLSSLSPRRVTARLSGGWSITASVQCPTGSQRSVLWYEGPWCGEGSATDQRGSEGRA